MEAEMKVWKCFFVLTMVLVPLALFGQDDELEKAPGYIDLDQVFDFKKDTATTEIEIMNPLLSIVAEASEAEDPELAKLLSFLKFIKVYSFPTAPEQFDSIKERIDRADKKMLDRKWERFVRVKKSHELTNIYMKLAGKKVVGLTILAVDKDETVFVNIVGTIDMSSIGKLGQKFSIPKLDSVQTAH